MKTPVKAHSIPPLFCRKREFDSRFVSSLYHDMMTVSHPPTQKRRGKRPHPDDSSSGPVTESPVKKPKVDEPLSECAILDLID